MFQRLSIALFALGLLATGCQEKGTPTTSFVDGSPDIQIVDSRFVASGDSGGYSLGGGGQNYAIFKVHFTNNLSEQLFPVVTHFMLVGADGGRFAGSDSGATALVGISNDYSPMKKGESRDFVVGFRVGLQQAGQIVYEY